MGLKMSLIRLDKFKVQQNYQPYHHKVPPYSTRYGHLNVLTSVRLYWNLHDSDRL